ncbi:MAG: hypothetical protein M0042_06670 [Nitrospiraceae bacterium]|nr:hypothetical protein [Nitrospiraceae bacterium]
MKRLVLIVAALAGVLVLSACSGGGSSSSGNSTGSVPPAPTGVKAACGNKKITLSWTATTGADTYNVYRSAASGSAGALLANSAATSYVDSTGSVGTTYYYTVTAVNSSGESPASGEVSETFYKLLAGALQGTSLTLGNSVSTFAGSSGFSGLTDGIGSAARFDLPQGMATDGTSLFVADYLNNVIRKIDPATQTVSIFAGSASGASGYADGVGKSALFFRPYDITSDGTNLYVTEFNGCMIRKIDIATATVSTFAGQSGVCSPSTDGTGSAAIFAKPKGITTDGTSLFITDGFRVRKVDIATAAVSTFAGTGSAGHNDGTGTAASFNQLEGITTDGSSLYVVDWYYYDIRKIDIATAAVTSLAGNYTVVNSTTSNDGTGMGATFNKPAAITTDGTNLYVAEYGNNVIRKVVIASAAVTTIAGSAGQTGTNDGVGAAARFSSPQGITTYCGRLFVGDRGNSSIRMIH